ncbi:MAG: hypothetical protein AB1730_12330 [Myxococcota bacterium]|jgi:hypothetical protein
MFPLKVAVAALSLTALTGCFLEAEAREVCQRTPAFELAGSTAPLAAADRQLDLERWVDFAVPVSLDDDAWSLDVTLLRVTVRDADGSGGPDFLSRVELVVESLERRLTEPLGVALTTRADGSFGFEGALDVTPLLSGDTFRYRLEAQGTLPEGPRALEAEACVWTHLVVKLP